MGYSIRVTRQARDHLREIRNYIEKELISPQAAKATIAVIKETILSLRELPSRFPLTPEEFWAAQGIRRIVVKNYYVYYWIDETNHKVQIIGVIYIGRDQVKQLMHLDMQ